MQDVLSRLKEIASAVMYAAEGRELESVLQRIAEVAKELARTRYAALGVPDGFGGLRFFKTVGMTPEEIARLEHPPRGHGLIGAIMQEREALRLDHIRDDPRSVGFPPHHPPMESLLGVPIQLGQQLFGVLYLCDKADDTPFNERDQLLVETMAGYAALAIAGAQISQQRSRIALLEERERIGMELHDGVIQSLYGMGMQIELLRSASSIKPSELKPIVDNLNDVIEEIRGYITDLRRRSGAQISVRSALHDMVMRLHLPDKLSVEINAPDMIAPFTPAVFESIGLIVMEALSNAVRHADARHLWIYVVLDKHEFQIKIQDDGRGFDLAKLPQQAGESNGLGLPHMQRRARLYGGEVSIESTPGKGTTLTIRIPTRAY